MTKYITRFIGAVVYHGITMLAFIGIGVIVRDWLDNHEADLQKS